MWLHSLWKYGCALFARRKFENDEEITRGEATWSADEDRPRAQRRLAEVRRYPEYVGSRSLHLHGAGCDEASQ